MNKNGRNREKMKREGTWDKRTYVKVEKCKKTKTRRGKINGGVRRWETKWEGKQRGKGEWEKE